MWWALPMLPLVLAFNGDNFELECPDECDCHYFRINWVTDCSESNLTAVPYEELSQSVYVLQLSDNALETLEPFPPGMRARRLLVARNRLRAIERRVFRTLAYLIDLDLSANNISIIEPDAFVETHGLLSLELQDNPLGARDGPLLGSGTLQYIDLSRCQLPALGPDLFANLTSLTALDLSENPLRELATPAFHPLTSLETLRLNYCELASIEADTFSALVNLKTLELSGNYLTATDWPEVLGGLGRLEFLNLRNSSITYISEEAFSNCSNLVTLVLADNELRELDVAGTLGATLDSLELLDLSHCHVRGPLSPEAFANATRLKTLYLSGNPLFAADLKEALAPLPKLEKLFLSNCSLRSLPDTFNVFDNLLELDISHNPLVNVFTRLLAPLEKLEYLNMGYSNLSYLGPDSFVKMTSLKRLVLSGNDLMSLEAGLFGNLTQLTTIELEYCGLKRPLYANAFFKNLTYMDLREIKLGGNPMVIPESGPLFPKQLSQVTKLDMSDCNITELNPDVFITMENLTELNLAGNKLKTAEGSLSFLEKLRNLENLNLSNNNLTSIEPQIFDNNPSLNSLNLVGNPFVCDCKIAEMWDWANMIKGDLDVLVGAKTVERDIAVKGNKRKRNLYCRYSETQLRNGSVAASKAVPGRRPFLRPRELNYANRTWAKYVRESGCEPLVKVLTPAARLGEAVGAVGGEGVPWPAVGGLLAAVALLLAAAALALRLLRRSSAAPSSPVPPAQCQKQR